MNSVTNVFLKNLEIAQLVIDNEFHVKDSHDTTQLDFFPDHLAEIRIQSIAARLFKMTSDENFVSGVVAMLQHVYLPQEYLDSEELNEPS